MKKTTWVILFTISISVPSLAQGSSDSLKSSWNFNTGIYSYFVPDDFFILPIVKAETDKLHLEFRYNYEDRNTISAWAGYIFETGDELEFTATPMAAIVAGQTNGAAPGLELDLIYSDFELYSESEYLFNFDDGASNFFYSWNELTYSPAEFIWLGIAGQRTRAYKSDVEIQRGLLIGSGYNNWEINAYVFNLGLDNPFTVLSLTIDF